MTVNTVYEKICVLSPLSKPEYRQFDGIAFARLFSEVFSSVLRYNITAKSYVAYDGVCWNQENGDIIAEDYVKLFSRALQRYAYEHEESPKDFVKTAQGFGECNKRRTLLLDARSYHPISQTDFDQQPNLLNCLNGVLDLDTFHLMPHEPDLLMSKCASFEYQESAHSDLFHRFVADITDGDGEKARYLQTNLGYALTGENGQEQFIICYGRTTRNGKSTLLGTVEYLLGDYATTISPESLARKSYADGSKPSPDIARLYGIRFLQCAEPPRNMILDVALVKQLTGGDPTTARFLHQDAFTFYPCFKMFMNTNYLPVVTDDTLFSSGRVNVVEFNRHFEPHEQDIRLKQKLKSADNLSGIANWLIDGLRMYRQQEDRIFIPQSVRLATEAYRDKSDKIKSFFADRMIEAPQEGVSAKALYEEYSDWCKENGYGTENKGNFFEDLRMKGLLSPTGTVNGRTMKNVVKGFLIDFHAKYRGEK